MSSFIVHPGKDFISLHEPVFVGNEKKYVMDAIDSTFVSSVGKYVDRFEKEFLTKNGT
jgi:perosamine synthetase